MAATASHTKPASRDLQAEEVGEPNSVSTQLRALETMAYKDLQVAWRRHFRVRPPNRASRDLLMLGIAWKIQERAFGGLSAAVKRRLAEEAQCLGQKGDVARPRIIRTKPGARLVRAWGGVTHTLVVREDGFEWQGQIWGSLSAIAREITGARWSGPRFFGLTAAAKGEGQNGTA